MWYVLQVVLYIVWYLLLRRVGSKSPVIYAVVASLATTALLAAVWHLFKALLPFILIAIVVLFVVFLFRKSKSATT